MKIAIAMAAVLCIASTGVVYLALRLRSTTRELDRKTAEMSSEYASVHALCEMAASRLRVDADALESPNAASIGERVFEAYYVASEPVVERCSKKPFGSSRSGRISNCKIHQDYKCLADVAREAASDIQGAAEATPR